ncbi:MAG: ROK family protein [Planctomycetales bacterium]|nr:ROK family protein [Planctomycetales bacterium]
MTSQPLIPLSDATLPLFIGVDVGGTSIKVGVVDDRGATLGFTRVSTEPYQPGEQAVARVGVALAAMLEDREIDRTLIRGVGLGSPGTMDIPTGMLLEPPNLYAWHQFPIRDTMQSVLGLPVTFANDGAAAAYGEFWLGAGREDPSIVMLTLGTGVGGGIIHRGRSIDGEHSHGSECGHVIIDSRPDARVCSCGQPGHLEAYASATAVVARTREALQRGRSSTLEHVTSELTALDVAEAAAAGDALALEIVDETADYLAIGIVSVVHTIDPNMVILGGAMNFGGMASAVGRRFLARIQSQFRAKTFPTLAERTKIDFAALGGDAGYLGAAGLARSAHKDP